jgi:hypothetical protein
VASVFVLLAAVVGIGVYGVLGLMQGGLDDDGYGLALAGGALMGLLVWVATFVLAAVFFGIWIHRAAKNLPALGATYLQFTPGWCVGWFYVPIMSLFKPYQAMREIWQQSEPDADATPVYGVMPSNGTPLMPLWWGAWLGSAVAFNVSGRMTEMSAITKVALVASALQVVAGIACVLLMRQVAARQERTALRRVPSAVPAPG